MAEIHVIGTLIGATGFPQSNLCCAYKIVTGDNWTLLEGKKGSRTQIDCPVDDKHTVFSHPIDLHFTTTTLKGWPKMQFEVFHQDIYGRLELYGYAFANIPMATGNQDIQVPVWRPIGSFRERLWSFFMGVNPKLRNLDAIHHANDRYRLRTETMGSLHLELTVIAKGFEEHGIYL